MFNPYNKIITYNATLMYKDNKVFDFSFVVYNFNLQIDKITKIYNNDLIPIALKTQKNINEWIRCRCFSNLTPKYNDIIYCLCGMPNFISNRIYGAQTALSLFSYGANLTDKYWINPQDPIVFYSDIEDKGYLDEKIIYPTTYSQINFFTKPNVAIDFGKVFLQYCNPQILVTDFRTPEICTNGTSKKRWILQNDKYFLQKLSHTTDERITFLDFLKEINPQIVPNYQIKEIKLDGFTKKQTIIETECFTTNDTELITAYDIILSTPPKTNNLFDLFKQNYFKISNDALKIEEICYTLEKYKEKTKKDITQFDNFGFIKNTNTKEIIKPIIWSNL
jgi:hypothetical protein